jgi:hypothetical protein
MLTIRPGPRFRLLLAGGLSSGGIGGNMKSDFTWLWRVLVAATLSLAAVLPT